MRRFIWDFRGRDGHGTAIHHQKHLDAFALNNNIPSESYKIGLIDETPIHSISYMEVDQQYEEILINLLKPQRIEEM